MKMSRCHECKNRKLLHKNGLCLSCEARRDKHRRKEEKWAMVAEREKRAKRNETN